ncbi:hypothetical protein AB0E10_43980 [Streptomyces sp. NPDC048045]
MDSNVQVLCHGCHGAQDTHRFQV